MSASSYGVTNTCCPAVADLSPASQALAGWLACSGRSAGPPGRDGQPATPPTSYGLLITAALESSAGSIAHVSCALCECERPACSNPASRPPLPKLAARPLFSSPAHLPWRGWSISGQIHATSWRCASPRLFVPGQNGRNVRLTVRCEPALSTSAASG